MLQAIPDCLCTIISYCLSCNRIKLFTHTHNHTMFHRFINDHIDLHQDTIRILAYWYKRLNTIDAVLCGEWVLSSVV